MISRFKATALLSGSSLVSIFLSLVSAKVMASLLKPVGYGYYGLLQSFVGLVSLAVGIGMATGLVRLGAGAAQRDDSAALSGLRRGAWLILAGLSLLSLIVCAIFRTDVSRWALGSADHRGTILLLIIATFFTAAANVQSGVLNAYHRVRVLAKSSVLSSIIGTCCSITVVLIWRVQGAILATMAGAIVTCAVSAYFLHREVGPVRTSVTWHDSWKGVKSLLSFGGPYTASLLVSSGVQFALPMLILHMLGTESVGYYKAASAISVGYLGFLVTAMGQDYYPRVSAVAGQPRALASTVNEQHKLVMMLAAPVILGTLALVPYLVPLVYSAQFGPAVEILEWQLIGDLFKFSSWTMSFVILARCSSWVLLMTESTVGLTSIVATWFTVRIWGLQALGISFLISYVLYYIVVSVLIRREIAFVWTSENKRLIVEAIIAALIVRLMPMAGLAAWRTPVALGLALGSAVRALIWIRRQLSSDERVPVTEAVAQSA
jgi:antigen flippase